MSEEAAKYVVNRGGARPGAGRKTKYEKTVVMRVPEKYQDDEVNTFYTFDGSKFQETLKPKFWLFGHVHHRQNFLINETNYLSNPYGYPSEQKYLKTMLQKVTLSAGE